MNSFVSSLRSSRLAVAWQRLPASLAVALVFTVQNGFAQRVLEATSLKFAEYYDPPNQTQIKVLMEGASARPEAGGKRTVFTDARVQSFSVTGQPDLIVKTPECLHDQVLHTISSAGPLYLASGDNRFSIEGRGFLWLQTNSVLFISNDVHTVIYPDSGIALTNKSQAAAVSLASNRVEIFSRQFAYSADSGVGHYQEEVQVKGTNFNLSSGELTIVLPHQQRQLQTIEADNNVIFDYENIHATAGHMVYGVSNAVATLTEHPAWSSEQREGRADRLVIDRTNKIFRADGKAWLRMPRQTGDDFLTAGETQKPNAIRLTNEFIEVYSDYHEVRTNVAMFGDRVLVLDKANEMTNGTMKAATMELFFHGTNQLETMKADRDVEIVHGDKQFAGQNAVYNATNGILELTGHPSWQAGLRTGSGDVLRASRERLDAIGNATMHLPASELGPPGIKKAAGNKPEPKVAPRAAPLFADVSSERYSLSPEISLFEGGVRIAHPQMDWACETMTVNNKPGAEKHSTLLAQNAVDFTLRNEQNQSVHGMCQRAFYRYDVTPSLTNDIVELTGNPVLETTNGIIHNRIIILDHGRNKLLAPGRYAIHGTAPPGVKGIPSFKK